jgi:chromosome segregation ATPase
MKYFVVMLNSFFFL